MSTSTLEQIAKGGWGYTYERRDAVLAREVIALRERMEVQEDRDFSRFMEGTGHPLDALPADQLEAKIRDLGSALAEARAALAQIAELEAMTEPSWRRKAQRIAADALDQHDPDTGAVA